MSTVYALLVEEQALVERFLDSLQREQAALRAGDADALLPISEEKSSLVTALNGIETRRIALMGISGIENGKNGVARWLADHPGEVKAATTWDIIIRLATEARQLHELNGQLLAMHLGRTRDALDILTQRPRESSLYGSDGQNAQGTGSRIVDSA